MRHLGIFNRSVSLQLRNMRLLHATMQRYRAPHVTNRNISAWDVRDLIVKLPDVKGVKFLITKSSVRLPDVPQRDVDVQKDA